MTRSERMLLWAASKAQAGPGGNACLSKPAATAALQALPPGGGYQLWCRLLFSTSIGLAASRARGWVR